MGICGKYNFSFAVFNALHEIFFILSDDKRQMRGILGNHMNRLLDRVDRRRCVMVETKAFGKKLANLSYDGLLGQIERKEVDFYYKTETFFHEESDLFEFAPPFTAQHFQTGQFLDPAKQSSADLTLFLTQNLDFIAQLVVAFVIVYFVLIFFLANRQDQINQKVFGRENLRNVANSLIGFENRFADLSKTGLIILFYGLYVFLFINCLTSNLRTEQTIVDTSTIIKDKWKLLETDKILCYFIGEIDYILASESPKGTFLRKIFDSKQFKIPFLGAGGKMQYECAFPAESITVASFNLLFSNKISRYFFLMNRTSALIVSALLSRMFEDYSLFIGEKSFYEMIYVSVIRKSLEKEKKQWLHSTIRIETEAGLYMNLVNNFDYDLMKYVGKQTQIYATVDEFVDAHVFTEELKIEYFKPLLFGLLIIGLTLLSINYASNFLIRNMKKMLSWSSRRFRSLIRYFKHFT